MMRMRLVAVFSALVVIGVLGGGGLTHAGSSSMERERLASSTPSAEELLATASALQTQAAQLQTTAAPRSASSPQAQSSLPPLPKSAMDVDKTWRPVLKDIQTMMDRLEPACASNPVSGGVHYAISQGDSPEKAWEIVQEQSPYFPDWTDLVQQYQTDWATAHDTDPNAPAWAPEEPPTMYQIALRLDAEHPGCSVGAQGN